MKEIIIIKGTYCRDTDDKLCIDVFTPGLGHDMVCLEELMKDNVPEGSTLEIEIAVYKSECAI